MYVYMCILCAEGTPLTATSGQKRAAPRPGGLCATKKSKEDGPEGTKEGIYNYISAAFHACIA